MRVLRDTPFEFGFITWQFRPSETSLVVVIKGTFDLTPEIPPAPALMALKQAPVSGEVHYEDDLAQSLALDTDFALLKPRGDCWVRGSCYAPGGVAATRVTCAIHVGAVRKSVAVSGDRDWGSGELVPTPPAPFTAMPLRWERSFGGPGSQVNPVGAGLALVPTARGARRLLPNLEDSLTLIAAPGDRPTPTGLSPIPRSWPARMSRTGTYDQSWLSTRWPHLPDDFDFAYYNATPRDQQIEGYWRGDEELGLLNLNPLHPKVSTSLPGVVARAFLVLEGDGADGFGEMQEIALRLDTIVLDGDALQAQCVFRGHAPVADERLTGVSHLFYVHQGLDEDHPLEHYRAWFLRRLAEDDDDDGEEAEPEAPSELAMLESLRPALASVDLTPEQVVEMMAVPPTPLKLGESRASIAAGIAAMVAAGQPIPPELESLDQELATLERQGGVDGAELRRRVMEQLAAGERSFKEADLAGADLSDLDLRGLDFSGAMLRGARLDRARFDASNLDECNLDECSLDGCSFTGASMEKATLTDARGEGCVFDDVSAAELDAEGARLPDSSWLRAVLDRAEMVRCDLARASFVEASLEEADLTDAKAPDSDFSRCRAVSAVLDRIDAPRVKMIEANLERVSITEGAELSGGVFTRAQAPGSRWNDARLHRADFSHALLPRADFTGAVLVEASLNGCDLRGATFRGARLVAVRMLRADVFEGCFEDADLSFADLRGANLFGAEFWRARVDDAQLELADLKRSKLEGRAT